uniref:Uncharacterized protein n=1 Tax=Rhizophora mucronata TaxID=61149 RepID=A0A2P2J5Z5_RHIMU
MDKLEFLFCYLQYDCSSAECIYRPTNTIAVS